MNLTPKCPKCGNTTFHVVKIPIAGHVDYEVVICDADGCGAIIAPYIPMVNVHLTEIQVKVDELIRKTSAP
jgi:hypothetical protein